MEWKPFGEKCSVRVSADRKAKNVFISVDGKLALMSTNEAIHLSETLIKAVKHNMKGIEWAKK